jgi:4-amino-4-deoxychorismate lyase
MMWINGEQGDVISCRDRGLSFGDGFFTTMRVQQGCIELLGAHIERIRCSALRLGIAPLPLEAIVDFVQERARLMVSGGLKLMVTRGCGGQGYAVPDVVQASWIVSQFQLPEHYVAQRRTGIALGVSPITLAIGNCFSDLKTLNRLEQVAIKRAVTQSPDDDHLCLDRSGHMVEASAANLFWRCGNAVFTPCLCLAGIHGLMRQWVIDKLEAQGVAVTQGPFKLDALAHADEIFLTNCLMPLLPVRQFNQRILTDFSMTHTLLNDLEPTQ